MRFINMRASFTTALPHCATVSTVKSISSLCMCVCGSGEGVTSLRGEGLEGHFEKRYYRIKYKKNNESQMQ